MENLLGYLQSTKEKRHALVDKANQFLNCVLQAESIKSRALSTNNERRPNTRMVSSKKRTVITRGAERRLTSIVDKKRLSLSWVDHPLNTTHLK